MVPAANTTMEPEFNRLAPEGTSVHFARMISLDAPGMLTAEGLLDQNKHIDGCADELRAAEVDLIVYGCTTGSLLMGVGYDEEITLRIQKRGGIGALSTSTAVLDALRSLRVSRVAVATPYPEDLNRKEKDFLEGNGIQVTRIEGLGVPGPISAHRPEVAYRLARKVDGKDAEGIFISCTNFRTIEIISKLENDTGKPVVTSNQATMWRALRTISVDDKIAGFGQLLAEPLQMS